HGRDGGPARQRVPLLPGGREDGRPLLHRLPIVLEHRRALPLPLRRAGDGIGAGDARARGAGVLAAALHLPVAHGVAPALDRRPRCAVGGVGRLARPDARRATAGFDQRVPALSDLLQLPFVLPAVAGSYETSHSMSLRSSLSARAGGPTSLSAETL